MRLRMALLCLAVTACGSNEGDSNLSDGTCSLRADVSGGTSMQFTGNDDAACLTQHSFDSGLDVTFSGLGGNGTLGLSIDDVTEGETGDFAVEVGVMNAAKERWRGVDCTIAITEHELLEVEASEIGELRHYQVAGQGACTEPLESVPAGNDPVTVGALGFRAQFTWRD